MAVLYVKDTQIVYATYQRLKLQQDWAEKGCAKSTEVISSAVLEDTSDSGTGWMTKPLQHLGGLNS